jgi:hypothetical protein
MTGRPGGLSHARDGCVYRVEQVSDLLVRGVSDSDPGPEAPMTGRPGGPPHTWDCSVEQVSDLLVPGVSDSNAGPEAPVTGRWGPLPHGARAFLPARGETDQAAPPKNHEMNRRVVAFCRHAAPTELGRGLGCGCYKHVAPAGPGRGADGCCPGAPTLLDLGVSAPLRHPRAESARGLAQSRTLTRGPGALEGREASWSAAVPCRFYQAARREGGERLGHPGAGYLLPVGLFHSSLSARFLAHPSVTR